MTKGDIIWVALCVVNAIVFALSVIRLKGVKYKKQIVKNGLVRYEEMIKMEWQKIKLPIICWISLVALIVVPILGGIGVAAITSYEVNSIEQEDEKYSVCYTRLYYKMSNICKSIVKVLEKSYKWLFIKI